MVMITKDIDLNNDGDFLDPNEEVFSGANPPNLMEQMELIHQPEMVH